MRIIEIKENQKEEWNKFIAFNNSESFLQSWQWGDFQQATGKKIFRIGVEDKDELVSVALLIKHNLPLGKSYLYCPRGPVISNSSQYSVSSINDFLFSEIQKISKKEMSLFVKIDPPISRGFHSPERLWNLECKTADTDPQPGVYPVLRYGRTMEPPLSIFANFQKSSTEIQPKDTLVLNLEKSEEELLKEMKQKTRYNIRLAEKKGVQIRNYELGITNQEEFKKKFEKFWKLVEETSKRDKFASHSKEYYWKMLESLSGKDQVQDDKQNLYAKLYLAEYEGRTIAANIVLYFGDLAVYLHGSSSNEYRNLMAPYLLQWQQIQDAKNAGYKKYDFWGITIDGEKETWRGITKFKKGFGGSEKKYVGAYDLTFNKFGYKLYQSMRKIRYKYQMLGKK